MSLELIPEDLYQYVPFTSFAGYPCRYSFRKKPEMGEGFERINVVPRSIQESKYMIQDLSLKQTNLEWDYLLDHVPHIKIREYRVSPVLNNILNNMNALVTGFNTAQTVVEKGNLSALAVDSLNLLKGVFGSENKWKGVLDIFRELFSKTVDNAFTFKSDDIKLKKPEMNLLLSVPFMLYYQVIGA
jgi:hypothetical protein